MEMMVGMRRSHDMKSPTCFVTEAIELGLSAYRGADGDQ